MDKRFDIAMQHSSETSPKQKRKKFEAAEDHSIMEILTWILNFLDLLSFCVAGSGLLDSDPPPGGGGERLCSGSA